MQQNCNVCGAAMEFQQLSRVYVCSQCGKVTIPDNEAAARAEADSVTVMRLALQFYADETNYQGALPVLADRGELARAALDTFLDTFFGVG